MRPKDLTHWSWVTYICLSNLAIIGSNYGLSPGRRQAIIWTNAGILLMGPLGTNSEISIGIHILSLKKTHLKMSSAKWHLFCLGLIVLNKVNENFKYIFFKKNWCFFADFIELYHHYYQTVHMKYIGSKMQSSSIMKNIFARLLHVMC